jgi:hypothetical protein
MECEDLQNDSPWLSCNDINNLERVQFLCDLLVESLFDIQVLDNQNNPVTTPSSFEGSTEGTTIENLEPGTYTVNEIKSSSNFNQLGEDSTTEQECISAGFLGGGNLQVANQDFSHFYFICFQYGDEEDNDIDCNTITLAAGEEKTCIVKNYIRFA